MIQIGNKFGRLIVVSKSDSKNGQSRWNCICDCGNTTTSYGSSLRKGTAGSCGCLRAERVAASKTKHGDAKNNSRSPTYRSWESMIRRVSSKKYKGYAKYGGRGIVVCDSWRSSYSDFLKDMGERPDGTSLDRINPDGNYEASNCRWADTYTQRNNRSKLKSI